MKQQRRKFVKAIYIGLFITLSILVLEGCMSTVQTSSNQTGSKSNDVAASPPSTPLKCPNNSGNEQPNPFVSKQGTQLIYEGKPLKLYGSTFYPALVGGSSAWHSSKFTQYIDHILALEARGGQNLVRPTDFWDRHYHDRKQDDIAIWKNMDYLVCTARQHGIFVVMDVSAFKWFLISQGENPYDARNWTAFLDAVGKRYANQPSIAFYSISGEPSPPHSVDEEFGMPQSMGDARYTGGVYNGIRTSRAQFFEDVYSLGEENGVYGFVFWDLGCELGDKSYQVGPKTPAVWHVIQEHAPYQPITPGTGAQLC